MPREAKEDLAVLHRVPSQSPEDLIDQRLERLNKEVRHPTDVAFFPNPAALLRLAGAVLVEVHEWQVNTERRYLSESSIALIAPKPSNDETEVAKPEPRTA